MKHLLFSDVADESPDLAQAWTQPPARRPGESQRVWVTRVVRDLARGWQGERAVLFPTMRAVAARLAVPLTTVSRAYEVLSRAGLLTRLRGSGTLLQPLRPRPRRLFRGVVGIVVWLPGFEILPEWRELVMALEDRLDRQNWVPELIFFRNEPPEQLADKLKARQLDYVVWLQPAPTGRDLLWQLQDAGVRCLALTDLPHAFPGRRYLLDWRTGLGMCLREWRKDGIRRLFYRGANHVRTEVAEAFANAFRQAGLPAEPMPGSATTLFRAALRDRHIGLIGEDLLVEEVLFRHDLPTALTMAARFRWLLPGPVSVPPWVRTHACVDLLRFDWPAIVSRIARDIASGQVADTAPPVTFRARWLPRVRLGDMPPY